MPKPSTQIIIDAIIKEIEQGKTFDTCLKLYGTKWNLTRSTFIRRWKDANEQHTAKQQGIKSKLAIIDEQAAIDARKKAIMSADDRKEWLTKMIMGEMKAKRPFVIGGKIMEYPEDPSHTDRLKALSELNKMEGDYSPLKVAQTNIAGENISNIPIFQNVPVGYVFGMLPSNTDGEDEQ